MEAALFGDILKESQTILKYLPKGGENRDD
jgi:hypothetical protein